MHGYAKSKFPPKGGFKWIDPKEFDLNKYTNNCSKRCVLETSHFIPTSRNGKRGWYNTFREQNSLLNQSSAKILLIGDSIISNLDRYPKIWEKNAFPAIAL